MAPILEGRDVLYPTWELLCRAVLGGVVAGK